MSNIVILTHDFPYGGSETFLEGEILHLAESFDRVLIVPTKVVGSTKMRVRALPSNVETLLISDSPIDSGTPKRILKDHLILQSLASVVGAFVHGKYLNPYNIRFLFAKYVVAYEKATIIQDVLKVEDFDIFYSYWGAEVALILQVLGYAIADRNTKLFISRQHGYDLYAERENLSRLPFQKGLLNFFDFVFPCSKQGESYLKGHYPAYLDKIRCSHLGVKIQSNIDCRDEHTSLRIVSCSNIVPLKRLDLIVQALSGLIRSVVWTHIGDGPEHERIFQLAESLPPNIEVNFMGSLSNREVLDYYESNWVDLFVNVSSSEGVPVSIMEAISFGIEPVATDVGGTSEVVSSDFGTLIPIDFSPSQLTKIMEDHTTNEAKRHAARAHQQKYFSTNNYLDFVHFVKIELSKRVQLI